MSSQGTLSSVVENGFERQLLEAWGNWARGDIGLNFTTPSLWHKSGVGTLFSDEDLMRADAAVARLPPAHKKTLKTVYIYLKGAKLDGGRKREAVMAFADILQGDGETGA